MSWISWFWLKQRRKEGIVLFNDTLNTFYLRLYDVGHVTKDHSDSERENPLLPHGLLFPISNKGSFICTIPQTGYHIPRPLLHQLWNTGWNEKAKTISSIIKENSLHPYYYILILVLLYIYKFKELMNTKRIN